MTYSTACPTFVIFWASSSEILIPNWSSSSMINSTRSSESASRSSWNEASSLISLSSTPSCSVSTSLTRSKTSSRDAAMAPHCLGDRKRADHNSHTLERAWGGLGRLRELLAEPLDDAVLGAARAEPDRVRDRAAARVPVRDHGQAAEPE